MSQFINTLSVTPLPDGQQWRLNDELEYHSDIAGVIKVPQHFVTDFASVPEFLWAILPPWGRYGPAAICHDWLYWNQGSRETADSVLREAMMHLGVAQGIVEQIYTGVRVFGAHAFEQNARLKALGYTRLSTNGDTPPYAGVPS